MKSMTGFSSVENSGVAGSFRVEMKSVNQKGLDVQMRLPRLCSAYEAALEKGIRARLARGKILVSGHLEVASGDTQNLVFDVAAARQVAAQLSEFAAETSGVDADLRSGDLAQMSVLWKAAAHEVDGDAVEELVFATMDAAVEGLVQSRAEEGAGLKKLLFAHLDTINKLVSQIAGLQAAHPEMQLTNYKKRLEVLLEDAPVQEERLLQEAAHLADRLDVSEEIDRLRLHIEHAKNLMEVGPSGRKLDFLCQEFLREANTVGSKCNQAAVAHLVVELKAEVEKMREQVQNVE